MKVLPDKKTLEKIPVFFIIGRERSGTTLLRTVFDAHPQVNIPVEFHFVWHLYYKYHRKKNWSRPQLLAFYQDLISLPRFNILTINKEQLKNDLLSLEGDTTYGTLCKVVLYRYQSFFDKGEILLLGDKCPMYSLYTRQLRKVFPEARFVHLRRDYRDNILSMYKVRIESHFFASLAYRWKYYNLKVEKEKQKDGRNFFSLKYEDFVSNPSLTLQQLSEFLSIPFVPESLEFYKKKEEFQKIYPSRVFEKTHKSLFQPISDKYIYAWKGSMTKGQIKLADAICGSFAEKMGYERQFKGSGIFLRLLYTPLILYGRSYYVWADFVSRLPLQLKTRLVFFLASLWGREWRRLQIPQQDDSRK